jgi:serine/threonine-protein kinase
MSDSTGVLQQSITGVFLFTDLVDATALKSTGDARAATIIAKHDELFRACLARHGGIEQDNAGDGFFAIFERPSDALRCALDFQQSMQRLQFDEPVQARVGMHWGEVSLLNSDREFSGKQKLIGQAVDTAARVMSLALGGQVLMTRHVFDSARQHVSTKGGSPAVSFLAHGPYLFKGVEEPMEVFEAGVAEIAPLSAPPNSEKARRAIAPGDDETLGWRPAVDKPIPGREQWLLEKQIGEGGFGEVWIARQSKTGEVRSFKFCFDAKRLRTLKRELTLFRLMKEVLGDRPDIAKLYDVRLDEAPFYLEMEYTAGGSLIDWAARQGGIDKVPLATRLEIIAQSATALAAAHSVGVIHKDIKPGNVLIHENKDGTVQARLTDFGIGQLVTSDLLAQAGITGTGFDGKGTVMTDLGSRTGTRLYMAPELMAGKPPTIQSDVYSLGVMLYQVMVGDLERPLAQGWERDVANALLREDIMACVTGQPAERLFSAKELSRRLSTMEQRLVEREVEIERVESERRRADAQTQANELKLVSDFQARMLSEVNVQDAGIRLMKDIRERFESALQKDDVPQAVIAARARTLSEELACVNTTDTAATMIDRMILRPAITAIDKQFTDRPVVNAALRQTIADLYRTLGRYGDAMQMQEVALKTRRRLLGDEHPDTLESVNKMGVLLQHQGKFAMAESYLREAFEKRRRVFGEDDPETIASLNNLGRLLKDQGKHAEAEAFLREALEKRRRVLGDEHPDTLSSMNNIGRVLRDQGKLTEAESYLREALEKRSRVLGEDHPDTIASINNLGRLLERQGNLAEAEAYYRTAMKKSGRVEGEEHPNTITSTYNTGSMLQKLGRHAEAIALFVSIESNARMAFTGGNAPRLARLLKDLGAARAGLSFEVQQFIAAETNLLESHAIFLETRGQKNAATNECVHALIDLYTAWNAAVPGKGYDKKAAEWREK